MTAVACGEVPASPAAQVSSTSTATPEQVSPPPTAVASVPTSATPPASPPPTPAVPTLPPPTALPAPTAAPPPSDACQGGTLCALNPQVTQATISSTICVSGWTATVRPPASYTSNLKAQQMAALHLPGSAKDYEEDHRVPLELGGHPSNPQNLTPELRVAAGGRAEVKDSDENAARTAVCSGSKSLAQAQADFVAGWLAPWPGYRSP